MEIEEILEFTLWSVLGLCMLVVGYPLVIGIVAGVCTHWAADRVRHVGSGSAVAIGWVVGLAATYGVIMLALHLGILWSFGGGDGCTGARYQC